jgi:chorismate dehydratase
MLSRSSMTSVALLELLFANVWHAKPEFAPGDAELTDVARFAAEPHDARLVIGDAALVLGTGRSRMSLKPAALAPTPYPFVYDLGAEWKRWTGLPFVFAVWVAQRSTSVDRALAVHATLIESRGWGLQHLDQLAERAASSSGVDSGACREYLSGLDYGLSYPHLAGLTNFFNRLVEVGRVPEGTLAFLGH